MKKPMILSAGLFLALNTPAGFGHDVDSCSVINTFGITETQNFNAASDILKKGERIITTPITLYGVDYYYFSLFSDLNGNPVYTELCSKVPVASKLPATWQGPNGQPEGSREQLVCEYTGASNSQQYQLEISIVNSGDDPVENCKNRLTRTGDFADGDGYGLMESKATLCNSGADRFCIIGLELKEQRNDAYITVQRGVGRGFYQ